MGNSQPVRNEAAAPVRWTPEPEPADNAGLVTHTLRAAIVAGLLSAPRLHGSSLAKPSARNAGDRVISLANGPIRCGAAGGTSPCGAGMRQGSVVAPSVSWRKLAALTEVARLASATLAPANVPGELSEDMAGPERL